MTDHQEIGRIVSAMSPEDRRSYARWIATKESGRVVTGSAAYYAWNRVHNAVDLAIDSDEATQEKVEYPPGGIGAAKRKAVEMAAKKFDVFAADITGRSRRRVAVVARHHAFMLLRHGGYSYPEIGRAMGVDHSTVQYGVRRALARARVSG